MKLPSKIAWMPHPGPQTEVLRRQEREVAFGGSRGPGKTEAGIYWFLKPEFIGNEECIGLVLRKNAKDLAEWVDRVRIAYRVVGARVVGAQSPVIKFPSGAKIYTGHLKDKNSYEQFMGWNITRLLIEELTQIPNEDIYERILSSVRSVIPNVRAQTFLTMNPGGPGHVWCKKRFVEKAYNQTYIVNPDAPEDRHLTRIFIPATIDDNPSLIEKDPGYVDWLEGLTDPKLRLAWRYGDWNTFSGQFFDQWDQEVHVVQDFTLPPQWNRFRSLDYGYFPGYTSVGWWAVDFNGVCYRYRELYVQQHTPSQVAQKVIGMTGRDENIITTLADPQCWARTHEGKGKYNEQQTLRSTADIFAENGFFCIQANNDRVNGWNNMKEYMFFDMNTDKRTHPKLRIFASCKDTIRTLPGLVHSDTKPEDMLKPGPENHKPDDVTDHCADDIRYFLMHAVTSRPPEREKCPQEIFEDEITAEAEMVDWETGT